MGTSTTVPECEWEENSDEGEEFSESLNLGLPQKRGVLTIFDWDDTLFPTSYVTEVVKACETPGLDIADSVSYPLFKQHSELIVDTLRTARAFGTVAIVSLSMASWIETCEKKYMNWSHLSDLLHELNITIYTRGNLSRFNGGDRFDCSVQCKAESMDKLLKREYEMNGPLHSVLCVGDSDYEKVAIKKVLRCMGQGKQPLCKTLKFVYNPPIEILGHQLRLLASWMPKIVALEENFDLVLDDNIFSR